MKNKIGFYSARAAEIFGTIIYKTPENKEIHVPAIMDEGEDIEHYKWEDKVCLGQVTEYVSQGYAGEMSIINHSSYITQTLRDYLQNCGGSVILVGKWSGSGG
jgi:hypothetical protein